MRKISLHDTTDTSAESVRLGVDAAKKGKRVVRTARETTRTAVRAAKTTVNILHHLIVHTVAILISPVTWVILAIGLVLYLLMTLLIILTGVAAQDNNAQHQAYATPVALGEDIPEEIQQAKAMFEAAENAEKQAYISQINALRFSTADMPHNDTVYLVRNRYHRSDQHAVLLLFIRRTDHADRSCSQLPSGDAERDLYLLVVQRIRQRNGESITTRPMLLSKNKVIWICSLI